jgi:hypothetical protein
VLSTTPTLQVHNSHLLTPAGIHCKYQPKRDTETALGEIYSIPAATRYNLYTGYKAFRENVSLTSKPAAAPSLLNCEINSSHTRRTVHLQKLYNWALRVYYDNVPVRNIYC